MGTHEYAVIDLQHSSALVTLDLNRNFRQHSATAKRFTRRPVFLQKPKSCIKIQEGPTKVVHSVKILALKIREYPVILKSYLTSTVLTWSSPKLLEKQSMKAAKSANPLCFKLKETWKWIKWNQLTSKHKYFNVFWKINCDSRKKKPQSSGPDSLDLTERYVVEYWIKNIEHLLFAKSEGLETYFLQRINRIWGCSGENC